MNKKVYLLLFCAIMSITLACKTTTDNVPGKDTITKEDPMQKYKAFLEVDPNSEEIFRVLMLSDNYQVGQMKKDDTIKRQADSSGDNFILEGMKNLDKVDVEREGVYTVWLFPDSGRLMKVRPKRPTFIREVDELILTDLQRWTFEFPKKVVDPVTFDIHYKVILRKQMTDEQIMDEAREKLKEQTGSR